MHTLQPVQSIADTWMRNLYPSSFALAQAGVVAAIVAKVSGALPASSASSRNGRMAACGHTTEHSLHCMHLLPSQMGMFTAIPRFSYLVVPIGFTPPGSNAETGRLLPFIASCGHSRSVTNFGASFFTSASSGASAHAAGTSTFTRLSTACSTAAMFMSTIFCPFEP